MLSKFQNYHCAMSNPVLPIFKKLELRLPRYQIEWASWPTLSNKSHAQCDQPDHSNQLSLTLTIRSTCQSVTLRDRGSTHQLKQRCTAVCCNRYYQTGSMSPCQPHLQASCTTSTVSTLLRKRWQPVTCPTYTMTCLPQSEAFMLNGYAYCAGTPPAQTHC